MTCNLIIKAQAVVLSFLDSRLRSYDILNTLDSGAGTGKASLIPWIPGQARNDTKGGTHKRDV